MATKHNIQTLLLAFMIDEGKYNPDKYSQNIEIVSSFNDSFTYLLKDPRLLLLSKDITKEQIKKYEYKIMALKGKIDTNGFIELLDNNYSSEEMIYRNGIIDFCLPEYPFLNNDAAILVNYNWTIDGMAQIFSLLENTSQDYYVGFGFREDDPKASDKRIVAEHFITELKQETNNVYDDFYSKYKNNELYMLAKKPKTYKKLYNTKKELL